MVLANVAAAQELERLHQPCMYRVHAPPSPEKLESLRGFLGTLDIRLKPAGEMQAGRSRPGAAARSPAPNSRRWSTRWCCERSRQAEYSPDNQGHFGLALAEYAHFTSPIRRYADLLVHRALIAGLRLGDDGLKRDAAEGAGGFTDTGEHITRTERRAALAERDAIDRYIAAHMADKIGASFEARISGVTRFGLFVTLLETGASGLVPISSLGASPGATQGALGADDFWMHDEAAQALTGRRSGRSYRLTQRVRVRLVEATPLTGGLLFSLDEDQAAASTARGPGQVASGRDRGHRGRGKLRP